MKDLSNAKLMKEYCHSKGLRLSADFIPVFNDKMKTEFDKSIARAKANNRKTLCLRDN